MDSENQSSNLDTVFLDQAEMTVDAKQRVGIPERFMKVLKSVAPDYTDRVGVIPTLDRSLALLPYPAFLKRIEFWKTLDERVGSQRTIKNLETSLAKELTLDTQNRIRLTPAQMKFCKIEQKKSDVIIVGKVDHMQIFASEVFDEMILRELENASEANDEVARGKTESNGSKPVTQEFVLEVRPKEAP